MIVPAALVVVGTLWLVATRGLRPALIGLLVQFAGVALLIEQIAPSHEVLLVATASVAATGLLYLAAGSPRYGEDASWRVWPAIAIGTAATALAYLAFTSRDVEQYLQLSAFWLLSSGLAVLLTARTSVRMSLGALLMLSGTQLVLRFYPGATLALSIVFAWVVVVVAAVGSWLIVAERAHELPR